MTLRRRRSCSPACSCRRSRSPPTCGSSGGRRSDGRRLPEPGRARLGRGAARAGGATCWPGCCSRRSTLLCVAVARPRIPLSTTADRATVVLVVDVSVSMNATDVAPTRLEAARAAIGSFVDHVPRQRQGRARRVRRRPRVVITPPTTDRRCPEAGDRLADPRLRHRDRRRRRPRRRARALLDRRDRRARRPRPRRPASRSGAVVLLSDGTQTRGVLEPLGGARAGEAGRASPSTRSRSAPSRAR